MKVVEVKRPVSGERIGYRIVLAFPNKAKWCPRSEEYVQSFAPKYRLCESGDSTKQPDPAKVAEFLAESMKWHKIDKIVPY